MQFSNFDIELKVCFKGYKKIHKKVRVSILLTDLTPPHFVPVPSHDLDFHTSWSLWCSMMREVVVCFVDIGGIIDHHCLNFLFIICIYMYIGKEHTVLKYKSNIEINWSSASMAILKRFGSWS